MSSDRGSRTQTVIISVIAALMLTIAPLPDWAAAFRPTNSPPSNT